jgi:hypothetical protein
MSKKIISVIIFLSLVFITACEKKQQDIPADEKSKVGTEVDGKMTLQNPWVRLAGKGMNTAMFLEIVNSTILNDTLISVDSDVAELVEIHETYRSENDMMGMRRVEYVEIPAGQKVTLKPMSLHVMLISLKNDLLLGDSVKATMNFKVNPPLEIVGIVKELKMDTPAKVK